MFEALVARVRYHIQKANFMGLKEAESTLLLAEAADAIEELSKRVTDWIPPHGRLIDADALIKELEITEEDDHNGATLLMAVFLEVLKSAPTIIQASKEVNK